MTARTTPTDRRHRFRAILSGPGCIRPASVWDALSGRIAADLGYEAGILAGSTASLAVLGAPDLIVLTLTEFADQARRIGRACDLPLLVDADHGYGNALNTMRTVQELEAAGVAALTIEDTELPQRYGGGTHLLPLAEGAGKVAAALAARTDPALVIVARTGALAITGVEDAVARVRAYAALGADAVFLAGVQDVTQVAAVAEATSLPLIVAGAGPPGPTTRLHLLGHQPIQAAIAAIQQAMQALRQGTSPADLTGLADPNLMRRATRADEYEAWTKQFLNG